MQIELSKSELALLLYLIEELASLQVLSPVENILKAKLQEIFDSTI